MPPRMATGERGPVFFRLATRTGVVASSVHATQQMKRLLPILLTACLLTTSGCISTNVVKKKAKAHMEYDPVEDLEKPVDGQPGYYVLLPFTVVADIITSPVQLLYIEKGSVSHASGTIYGWPVDLW
jgi:PhoPQ-activated pathogenicity-related protein